MSNLNHFVHDMLFSPSGKRNFCFIAENVRMNPHCIGRVKKNFHFQISKWSADLSWNWIEILQRREFCFKRGKRRRKKGHRKYGNWEFWVSKMEI